MDGVGIGRHQRIQLPEAEADAAPVEVNRHLADLRVDRFDASEPTVQRIRPRIIPLAQFKPTRISSDPAQGEQAVRLGEETENAEEIAPDVYTTQYGGWASTLIRTWPTGWDRLVPAANPEEDRL